MVITGMQMVLFQVIVRIIKYLFCFLIIMKSKKNRKSLRRKKRKSKQNSNPNTNLVQNYILKEHQKHQIILNKNGLQKDTKQFQDQIENISQRAFKYSQNARFLGNQLFLQEIKKNIT